MIHCPRCSAEMAPTPTRRGVMLDICRKCHGVWLDKGELRFFTKDPSLLSAYQRDGLQNPERTLFACPRCKVNLHRGQMPGMNFQMEECEQCRGFFLDKGEFEKFGCHIKVNGTAEDKMTGRAPTVDLPALGFTSFAVLTSMYAFLIALIVFLVESSQVNPTVGVLVVIGFIAIQFIIGPFIMDWSLQLFGSLAWVGVESLPGNLPTRLKDLCQKHNLPLPEVGIIDDGSPQAYTYGRTPKSARLVFSRGLFELLDEEEVVAVMAHELGHIKHWDFVVMTIAQMVPIILYHLYRLCRDLNRKGSRRKKGNGAAASAALAAYIAYYISEYLVKYVSRVREYHADRFSCFATKNPNALLKALTKIGFGLVAHRPTDDDEKKSYDQKRSAVQSLAIMNVSGSKELALAFQGDSNMTRDPNVLKDIMRWDLWSPWAAYYELHSTHPLTSKRINAIGSHATELGLKPYVVFDLKRPESYWDDFFSDVLLVSLPWVFAILFPVVNHLLGPETRIQWPVFPIAAGFSFGWLIRTLAQYPRGEATPASVGALLRLIKVSPVRSYRVRMQGEIIGRGESGNIFSEDMVFRDPTGIIFLDHEPFGFNFYFALTKFKNYRGKEVMVEGWYRRAPVPYIEVERIMSRDGDSSHSYTYYYKLAACILIPLVIWIGMMAR